MLLWSVVAISMVACRDLADPPTRGLWLETAGGPPVSHARPRALHCEQGIPPSHCYGQRAIEAGIHILPTLILRVWHGTLHQTISSALSLVLECRGETYQALAAYRARLARLAGPPSIVSLSYRSNVEMKLVLEESPGMARDRKQFLCSRRTARSVYTRCISCYI